VTDELIQAKRMHLLFAYRLTHWVVGLSTAAFSEFIAQSE